MLLTIMNIIEFGIKSLTTYPIDLSDSLPGERLFSHSVTVTVPTLHHGSVVESKISAAPNETWSKAGPFYCP